MSKLAATIEPPPVPARVYRADGQYWVNEAYLDKAVREAVEHADAAHGGVDRDIEPKGYTFDQIRELLLRLGHSEDDMWRASKLLGDIEAGQ